MLSSLSLDNSATKHHERLDGSGYPSRLSGQDIILEARVLGVADVVETMAFDLPNRPALGLDKALEEISRNRGILYDPEVVGGRDNVTLRRLWERIARPGCTYYTDDWAVYPDVIPPGQHVVSKGGTQLLENDNANTRHRVGRFTRRTKVVSRSETMIDLTMRLWAYFEQDHNFAEYQKMFLCILG